MSSSLATSVNDNNNDNNTSPPENKTEMAVWGAVDVTEGSNGNSNSNSTSGAIPFHMNFQTRKKRKRKHASHSFAASGSSSGSSSEEESADESGENTAKESPNSKSGNMSIGGSPKNNMENKESKCDKTASEASGSGNPPAGNTSQPEGWRVKLYRLNADGSWDDCGTGRIVCLYRQQPHKNSKNATTRSDQWLYQETGEATLCVHAEVSKQHPQPRVLLRTRILLRDAYQRQGDNIITWCEPYYAQLGDSSQPRNQQYQANGANSSGVDLALSFQDNAGCLDVWRQITHIQQCAAELLRQQEQPENVQDMATQVAADHHSDLQRQHQHQELWQHLAEEHANSNSDSEMQYGNIMEQALVQSLPNPPSLQNLEDIADTIAALQHAQHAPQQREGLALWIAKDECIYLKQLLALFPAAEAKGDYGKLATLAACVKTVLLLNEPSILELIVNVASMFEEVCSCLEYDPDLREKANHRWFLKERAKFRTVVAIQDQELISAIHRSFRVNFLRDTLLRPTMDESALTTLTSLLTFTHSEVVKGVMLSGSGKEVDIKDSYLVRVIRLLGVELHTLTAMEWVELERRASGENQTQIVDQEQDYLTGDPSIVVGEPSLNTTSWQQYLAPQDRSAASRRLRKRGCLTFLRELFNMVRLSLQQSDKDNFFPVICTLAIDLDEDNEPDNASQTSQTVEVGSVSSTVRFEGGGTDTDAMMTGVHSGDISPPISPVTLLTLLASVLSQTHADTSEKSCALEIISGVAMHDPSLIRLCCLEFHEAWKSNGGSSIKPEANDKKQVIFYCPPQDLLASLLFLLDVETDAGILLQVSEILRIILDTDSMGDQASLSAGFADEGEGIPPGSQQGPLHDQHNQPSGNAATSTDQKQFLSLFYEHYVSWLTAPFQFTVLHPVRRVPEHVLLSGGESPLLQYLTDKFKAGVTVGNEMLRSVSNCAIRCSFAVELLSFCVRAHLYRMKFFLLKSRVLGSVLKLLGRNQELHRASGDRCLKLAALRLLRAILSVNDEFYHRHIIQHDLFGPVFEAFRFNPVGDNLVSSAIVEMCDYIHSENIKSLLEYIVTKHLSQRGNESSRPSLEDVSSPYVSTLTVLRSAYEATLKRTSGTNSTGETPDSSQAASPGSKYFGASSPQSSRQLSGSALEDQRRFQQLDEEESYFDGDDDEMTMGTSNLPKVSNAAPSLTKTPPQGLGVDEVDMGTIKKENELRSSQRLFFGRDSTLAHSLATKNMDDLQGSPQK